jgi:putative SOS response-associated peptidase YedK
MCSRFFLDRIVDELVERYGLDVAEPMSPRYNIAPSQPIAVVRVGEGKRELAMLRWGLIPSWADDPKIGSRLVNARSETVADKPAFRSAYRHRRCLVPASGYYEWTMIDAKTKQPACIRMRDDALFAMAGLWERWEGEGRPIESVTILTTEPNELVGQVHDRMPVILSPAACERWLDGSADPGELGKLLRPYPADLMRWYEVSRLVNSPANDDQQCCEPSREGLFGS